MTGDAPAWAYEQAKVSPHDPRWAVRAEAERERLIETLGPWLVDGVEHIGSTAVPGLAAKPIVDLMASVADLEAVVAEASGLLADDGWSYVSPELDRRPWRRFFVKPDASGRRREAHLHLIRAGHARWDEQLRFRDALRHDERLAREYADLKERLAAEVGHDREAYTEGKAAFVARVVGASAEPSPGYAEERIAVLEALTRAVDSRAAVLDAIAASAGEDEAITRLRELLGVAEIGARAVLEMQFRRLMGDERAKLAAQLDELRGGY